MSFLLLCFQQGYSQSSAEINKLTNQSKGKGITSYNSMLKLCKYYWNYSFDTSIMYAGKAIKLSQKMDSDSLKSLANLYMALSYHLIDQLDSTLYYCNISKTTSEKYPKLSAKTDDILGITYRRLGNFKMALSYGEHSAETFKQEGDSLNYAISLGNVSTTLQEMGNVSEAINYSLKAAKIFKSLKDSMDLAKRYGTIANIYLDMSDLKNGIAYYNRGISLVDSTKHKSLYITFVFNMATVYHQMHEYDTAIYFYNLSLNHYKQVNDREGIAIANQNIGLSLIGKEAYKNAINYLQNAYLLFSNLYTIRNVADVLSDLGLAYSRAGFNDSAIIYMNMSVDTAVKYHLLTEELKGRELLYHVYKTKGSFASALLNLEKFKSLEDSMFSTETKQKIADLSMKYEAGIKDEKIKQLELNEKLTTIRNRTRIIILISVTILIILLVTILSLSIRFKFLIVFPLSFLCRCFHTYLFCSIIIPQ